MNTVWQRFLLVNYLQSDVQNHIGERKKKTKGDRRSTEISLVIRQTFESVILTHLFPRSQIDIFVQVLQADGGEENCSSFKIK